MRDKCESGNDHDVFEKELMDIFEEGLMDAGDNGVIYVNPFVDWIFDSSEENYLCKMAVVAGMCFKGFSAIKAVKILKDSIEGKLSEGETKH